MSLEDNVITVDANVVSANSVESRNITGVAVPKPKKSKRASHRGVTKRGSLGDDDNFTPTKPSIDNDGSDHVVELTYIPLDTMTSQLTSLLMRWSHLSHETNYVITTTTLSNPLRTTNLSPQRQRQIQHKVSLRIWLSTSN